MPGRVKLAKAMLAGEVAEGKAAEAVECESTACTRYAPALARPARPVAEKLLSLIRDTLAVAAVDPAGLHNRGLHRYPSPPASDPARRCALTFLIATMSGPPTQTLMTGAPCPRRSRNSHRLQTASSDIARTLRACRAHEAGV